MRACYYAAALWQSFEHVIQSTPKPSHALYSDTEPNRKDYKVSRLAQL